VGAANSRPAEVLFDISVAAGPNERLMNPAELLLSAFAACVLKDVGRYAGILSFAYERAEIVVRGVRQDARYKLFNLVHLHTRSTLWPIAICGLLSFDDFRAAVEPLMLTYVRAWVGLVQAARPLPADQRLAIAHRDHVLRRTIVEKDSANVLADRMLGVPMRERLLRIL